MAATALRTRLVMTWDAVVEVVEGSLGIHDGFWGSVAAGATFRSTGRKRTKPGRQVIARNRDGIDDAERIVGDHLRRWRAGEPTPCADVLHAYAKRWDALCDRQGVVLDWPSLDHVDTVRGAARLVG